MNRVRYDGTENAAPPKSTKSRNSILHYLAVQIQIQIQKYFEFVPRNLSFWIR